MTLKEYLDTICDKNQHPYIREIIEKRWPDFHQNPNDQTFENNLGTKVIVSYEENKTITFTEIKPSSKAVIVTWDYSDKKENLGNELTTITYQLNEENEFEEHIEEIYVSLNEPQDITKPTSYRNKRYILNANFIKDRFSQHSKNQNPASLSNEIVQIFGNKCARQVYAEEFLEFYYHNTAKECVKHSSFMNRGVWQEYITEINVNIQNLTDLRENAQIQQEDQNFIRRGLKLAEEPKITFYIELENFQRLFQILNDDRIQMNRQPSFQTPYQHISNGIELRVAQSHVSEFLRLISEAKGIDDLRIYLKEQNGYRPYIIRNPKYPNFYTTFWYKFLANSENFVAMDSEIIDRNFLEEFSFKNNRSNIEGYYKTSTQIPGNDRMVSTDTGLFETSYCEDNEAYCLETNAQNIRSLYGSYYLSPYDILFGIPSQKGVSSIVLNEYYLPFDDSFIIHFSDQTNIVEMYQKSENGLYQKPNHIFDKSQIRTELEARIKEKIELFFQQQKGYKRVKENAKEEIIETT